MDDQTLDDAALALAAAVTDRRDPRPARARLRAAAIAFAARCLEDAGERGTLDAIVLLGQLAEHGDVPACGWCLDTHVMTLAERSVPCTRCPRPCELCRAGAYCERTPCACACHAGDR